MKTPKNAIVKMPVVKNRGGDLNKQWYVQYGYRNPKTGEMRYFRYVKGINQHKTKKKRQEACEIVCDELSTKLRAGWSPYDVEKSYIYDDDLEYREHGFKYEKAKRSNRNFRYCVQPYLQMMSRKRKPETIGTYRSKFRIFAKWLDFKGYGDYDITEINHSIVVAFFEHLIDERKVSKNTVGKYKQLLGALWEFMIENKTVRMSPMHSLPDTGAKNEKPIWPIRQRDIMKFKEKLKDDPWLYLAVMFEFYCALRPGKELRLLKIKDIDFDEQTVFVSKERAKSGRNRIVLIPSVFMDIIKNDYELHKYPQELFVFGIEDKKYGPGQKPVGKNTMRHRFNRIREKCGMPLEYKFYSWKHTGAMAMIRNGASIFEVSTHMGHVDKASTEHYINNKFGEQNEFVKNRYPEL